jgi:histidinol-phosphate aminotransferase
MTDLKYLVPEYIQAINRYLPGKPISELARELGLDDIIKLASNENPRGPSPAAVKAIHAALPELTRYPDGNGFELKAALSARYDLPADWIVLGNGSNDLLEMASLVFLHPGVSAVYSQHAFAVYPLATQARGATRIEVPAREFGHDLAAMKAAIRPDTRLMFIANPNNPTGTSIDPAALEAFIASVPEHVMVVLDEAYNEYLPAGHEMHSAGWVKRHPKLIVTRTFSKAYGLAALRVGYGLMRPELADLFNRVRQPFNVNSLALVAAHAALGDQAYLEASRRENTAGLKQLMAGFEKLGVAYIPSAGNFICAKVGDAPKVYQALLKAGIIVRPVSNYGMPEYLRITVGLAEENERFLAALAGARKV